ARRRRRCLRAAAAPLLARAACRRAAPRPARAPHAPRPARGRPALAHEQTLGLRVPHALPDRSAVVRGHPPHPHRARRPSRRLPALGMSTATTLTAEVATPLARRALANIAREYPNHPHYLLE